MLFDFLNQLWDCKHDNIIIMGNETAKAKRNKNSFSMDFGHMPEKKIKPSNQFKLEPINMQNDESSMARTNRLISRVRSEMRNNQHKKSPDESSREAAQKLAKLNKINDELRNELIKISSELTLKLKKKKYSPRKQEDEDYDRNDKKRDALRRQLENAYKQIDMYKRNIEELKGNDLSEKADEKLTGVENKISEIDLEIEKVSEEVQSVRNIMSNQNQGMKKDRGWQTVEQLKNEAQALRLRLRDITKQSRKREKKYMDQHQYMMALDRMNREMNGDYVPDQNKNSNSNNNNNNNMEKKQKIDEKEIAQAEEQLEQLKLKHDEYHKKINGLLMSNKQMKEEKREMKEQLQEKKKMIEGLKYKRDAFVKQIKDNLYLFATRQENDDEEEFSQFESEEEMEMEEVNPIEEENDERGTFDIEHLKDHTLKSKGKQIREKIPKATLQDGRQVEDPRVEPKLWKQRLTRIIEKGKSKEGERCFDAGLSKVPKKDLKIIRMNIWMTKKKQITAIQPVYLVDGEVLDGKKSSDNAEDEYRVTYQLDEHDYLKSILGIVSKNGFLQYLVLQSHFGKISRVGRSQTDGDNFAIGVSKEETPIQITGASSMDGDFWRINRLSFEVLIQSR